MSPQEFSVALVQLDTAKSGTAVQAADPAQSGIEYRQAIVIMHPQMINPSPFVSIHGAADNITLDFNEQSKAIKNRAFLCTQDILYL